MTQLRQVSVRTREGFRMVQTALTTEQAVHLLSQDSSEFARNLVKDYRRKGHLSRSQHDWLLVLAQERLNRQDRPAHDLGDFGPIARIFQRAQEHLKYPKIRLLVQDQPVVLSMAGERAREPGSINVTDGGKYQQGRWFGRISQEGKFTPGRDCTPAFTPELVALLQQFCQDPAGVAASYGRSHGNCCFCGLPLTNGKQGSVAVGYGPICAKHFGLPWEPNGRDYEYREGAPVHEQELLRERQLDLEYARREAQLEVQGFLSDPDYREQYEYTCGL